MSNFSGKELHVNPPIDPSDGIHDLRGHLNAILSSAMLLERTLSADSEHRKYVDWILEHSKGASHLIDSISRQIRDDVDSDFESIPPGTNPK